MFGSTVLDVAIGLAFIYLLLSMVCSSLNEMVAQWMNLRARMLEEAVRRLIADEDCRKTFYEHPLIKSISRKTSDGNAAHPSYIAAKDFAAALLDSVAPATQTAVKSFASVRDAIMQLDPASETRKALLAIMDNAGNDLDQARKNVEAWFDSAMDRVAGWYKRQTQNILLVLAIIVTVASNADTFALADSLWMQPALRQGVANAAEKYVAADPKPAPKPGDGKQADDKQDQQKQGPVGAQPPAKTPSLNALKQELDSLQLPLGWANSPTGGRAWFSKIIGLMLTCFAVSLGAPFWFDVVNRFVNLRSAGNKPLKSMQQNAPEQRKPRTNAIPTL